MKRFWLAWCLVAAIHATAAGAAQSAASAAPPALSADDLRLFQQLYDEFLTDPRGARYVRLKPPEKKTDGIVIDIFFGSRFTEGWLKIDADGKQRVYSTDDDHVLASDEFAEIDFVEMCRKRYDIVLPKADEEKELRRLNELYLGDSGTDGGADLVLAAWLHRLGHRELAARAVARVRSNYTRPEPFTTYYPAAIRRSLAWKAFSGMMWNFEYDDDKAAWRHGSRLFGLYRPEAEPYSSAFALIGDLERRRGAGRFEQPPRRRPPADYESWTVEHRIRHWISRLDEARGQQWISDGGVSFAYDPAVLALGAIGDAAMPALLDVLERDRRLARAVCHGDVGSTIIGVREPALEAVSSILGLRFPLERLPTPTFSDLPIDEQDRIVAQVQDYWRENGSLPFDRRMMKILTDPQAEKERKLEAAFNLAYCGDVRRLDRHVGGWTSVVIDPPGADAPRRAFRLPTIAEATLAAMDKVLQPFENTDPMAGTTAEYEEDRWFMAITKWNDRRIAPELAKRSRAAATTRLRRKWATAAHQHGDSEPLKELAAEIRVGSIRPGTAEKPWDRNYLELANILRDFANARLPETEQALWALADVEHPYYDELLRLIMWNDWRSGWHDRWFVHPFCLTILRRELDNLFPTGRRHIVPDEEFTYVVIRKNDGGGSEGYVLPEELKDARLRLPSVEERTCDVAAVKLRNLLFGLPFHHPLSIDADGELKRLKQAIDRYPSYRGVPAPHHSSDAVRFVPRIPPLEKAATAEDVAAGRAWFHLDGRGRRFDAKLPATAQEQYVVQYSPTQRSTSSRMVVIMQAEENAAGEVVYGVLDENGSHTVKAAALKWIRPIDEAQPSKNPTQ